MKKTYFIFLFIISSMGFAQNNYIVKTDDGRRVLLKADYTWEYIDAASSIQGSINKDIPKLVKNNGCNIPADFQEPNLNSKIQNQLKKGRATIHHVKKKVAEDNGCLVDDVILLSASEKKSNGFYDFCANGKKVRYKRVGSSIIKRKFL